MSEDQPLPVCIIPAYNEGNTVAEIAGLVSAHPEIGKVLVIDDGSEDSTSERASKVDGVQVIRLEPNRGKGAAMRAGLEATDEPVVIFLDADLTGLKATHISDLLEPVVSGKADMSVGLFRGGRIHTDLAHILAPSLSGQRAIKRSVLKGLDWETVGFGIERALTQLWSSGAIRVEKVIWRGVSHVTKEEKRGYLEGIRQRLGMYADIMRFEKGRFSRRKPPNKSEQE